MSKTHLFLEAVHFPDIDHGGGMYHGRYLDYLDKARQALLRDYGISFSDLIKARYGLVVVEANLRFLRPVLLGDTIHIYTRLVDDTDKVLIIEHLMTNGLLSESEISAPFSEIPARLHLATITLVGVDLTTKRAVSFPPELKSAIANMKAG